MPQDPRDRPLTEAELLAEPRAQFERWLAEAQAAGMIEPTAMTLATISRDGRPSARVVLFKGFDGDALTFYTNYESRKAAELAMYPHVALVFWWDKLERSVRVEGRVEKVARELSERYFHSRPRVSQLSASISRQSQVIGTRAELEQRAAERDRALAGGEVPLPENWGGYRVTPDLWEFWQGRRGRLHDRLVYRPSGDAWRIERLEP